MKITIRIGEGELSPQLAQLLVELGRILEGMAKLSQSFDNLTAAVKAETTVVQSFIRYNTELLAKLEAAQQAAIPEEAIQAVIDEARTTTDAVAAALVAGTAAENEAPAGPPNTAPAEPPASLTPQPPDSNPAATPPIDTTPVDSTGTATPSDSGAPPES
jgi:hypothetical protein